MGVPLPKWNDDFSTDPTSDPAYKITSGVTYNGTDDRVEIQASYNDKQALTKADSIKTSGIIIIDADPFPTAYPFSFWHLFYIRAFGYYFVCNRTGTSYVYHEEEEGWRGCNYVSCYDSLNKHIVRISSAIFSGVAEIKIIRSTFDVQLYLDNMLTLVLPARSFVGDLEIGNTNSGGGALTSYVNNLQMYADSSLPEAPDIYQPGMGGTINAAQEIIVDIPDSLLYVDLSAHAPGITGLSNVVWDPASVKTGPVAMTEDTGIPDRSGGTTGDYYVEIPSNSVASFYRMTIKKAFVAANSVTTGDTIGFDVDGGAAGQTGTVSEDDDLECILEIGGSSILANAGLSALRDLQFTPAQHNYNADNNYNLIKNGNSASFDGYAYGSSQNDYLSFEQTVNFPVILDVDLGKTYTVKSFAIQSKVISDSYSEVTNVDIYSNTSPFSGASLLQGTLEYSDYPVDLIGLGAAIPGNLPTDIPSGPDINIRARYWRFVLTDAVNDTNAPGGVIEVSGLRTFGEIDIRIISDSINSVDDAAQFEVDTGGGFGAWPGGGVTQNSGQVRITLPASLQVSDQIRNFISVKFKADLSD